MRDERGPEKQALQPRACLPPRHLPRENAYAMAACPGTAFPLSPRARPLVDVKGYAAAERFTRVMEAAAKGWAPQAQPRTPHRSWHA
jgi:hypothetical protein